MIQYMFRHVWGHFQVIVKRNELFDYFTYVSAAGDGVFVHEKSSTRPTSPAVYMSIQYKRSYRIMFHNYLKMTSTDRNM